MSFTLHLCRCVFLFLSSFLCVPLWVSGSFCVTCSPFYPSLSFSLSLGVPHFFLTCISVSDNLIGFHYVHILSFWSPLNRTPSSLLSREDLKKNSCLISMQRIQKTFVSTFQHIQTSQVEQGRGAKKPIKVSSQTNAFLVLLPKRRTAAALKIACFHLLKEMCQNFSIGCLWVARSALALFISTYFSEFSNLPKASLNYFIIIKSPMYYAPARHPI